MAETDKIKLALVKAGWMQRLGAYVLVDGAYGSCGKGAVAALIGTLFGDVINYATTNAGPNSGHIGYFRNHAGDLQQVKTQQLPVASVVAKGLYGDGVALPYLNSGAIIDPIILRDEAKRYGFDQHNLVVHPNAAIIDYDRRNDDVESTNRIASTSKGVGTALARKVMREEVTAKFRLQDFSGVASVETREIDYNRSIVWTESAQGYSLGIDQMFYPFTTSRICSVGQALADAAIPYNKVRGVIMVCRTTPIRVGNTSMGTSGDCYPDQQETTWDALGVPQELTTVTKRVRRVFTWSRQQFRDATRTNQPSVIFLSFMDYLKSKPVHDSFVHGVLDDYRMVMGKMPDAVLLGFGPYTTDVKLWEG